MKMRKSLSLLMASLMAAAAIPAVAFATDVDETAAPAYLGDEFFANGTPITITGTSEEGKTALITWDGGSQAIDENDTVYGGSDTTANNIHLASTSITMNGGSVKFIVGGNKTKNEKNCDYSQVDTVTLDINGGTVAGLFGIDNQNTAFGADVRKEANGKSYKNYSIGNLNVTIDGATVEDFRGVTSYAYAKNVDVVVGKEKEAQLGILIWGTNGVIDNASFTMYSGKTDVGRSIYRCNILEKMTYSILGGEIGTLYAGSYYPLEESAAGSNNWNGWSAGNIDYGYANSIEINIGKDAKYTDIVSGFQYRADDVDLFKEKYPANLWCIDDLKADAPIVLNLAAKPSAETLDEFSVIGSDAAYVTTNWKATSVSLDKTTLLMSTKDAAVKLNATVAPENTTDTLVWASSDEKVAKVAADGTVTPVAAGKATITATAGGVSAACEVTVYEVTEPSLPTVDPSKPVNDVTVGADETAKDVLADDTSKVVDNILAGNDVSGVVDDGTKAAVEEAVKNGVEITTKVEAVLLDGADVPADDKAAIESFVEAMKGEAAVAQYLDLKVLLLANNTEIGTLNKLSSPVTFTIAVPESLKAEGRTFTVVRIHDGAEEALETVMNKDGTLSFSTDRFSTYALVYTDAEKDPGTGEQPGGDGDTDVETPPDVDDTPDVDDNPETGDSFTTLLFAGLVALFACAGVLGSLSFRMKKAHHPK